MKPVPFGIARTDWTRNALPTGGLELRAPDDARNAGLRLLPVDGKNWDFSAYSYFRVDIRNSGTAVLWIEGRLENQDAKDWANSSASQLFLNPGESGALGFAYPRSGTFDDSPPVYAGMNAKLNGWRSHWKAFDPAHVLGVRLTVHSPETPAFEILECSLAWPYGSVTNARLEALPFLDAFGQVRPVDWEGKLHAAEELRQRAADEQVALKPLTALPGRDRFGGWADGPQLEATGFFRLTRHQGKWWFVDPDGRLFWSQGVNTVGFGSMTPATQDRLELFEWLPKPGDPLQPVILRTPGQRPMADFRAGNLARRHGADWEVPASDIIHRRLAAWGLNTLGAWSESMLVSQQRTPFTLVLHVGWPELEKGLPNPFAPEAPARLATALNRVAEQHRTNAWCLGVFIDNELHWNKQLVETVFAQPADHPAKVALVKHLRERHGDVARLNATWKTAYADWQALLQTTELKADTANSGDLDALMEFYAARYYDMCRHAMREIMPHHLYLGSRIHTCPAPVARAAARFVDVFSVNHYWNRAGTGTLPKDADVPVLITEFHFGALDRGVPGCGLMSVHDQTQRGRAYQNYVASGLVDPHIVGTHWFAWSDQSAAGRPGENYQIGFVDVTDTPYPEFTDACRRLAERMYLIRSTPDSQPLSILSSLFAPQVKRTPLENAAIQR